MVQYACFLRFFMISHHPVFLPSIWFYLLANCRQACLVCNLLIFKLNKEIKDYVVKFKIIHISMIFLSMNGKGKRDITLAIVFLTT